MYTKAKSNRNATLYNHSKHSSRGGAELKVKFSLMFVSYITIRHGLVFLENYYLLSKWPTAPYVAPLEWRKHLLGNVKSDQPRVRVRPPWPAVA